MDREKLVDILLKAQAKGAIQNIQDIDLRDIRFDSADNRQEFKIIWYCNLCTLILPGFSLWFDDLQVESTHPSMKVHLTLFHANRTVAHIGKVY